MAKGFKNIILDPKADKSSINSAFEAMFPYFIELRNGSRTQLGNWVRRPGHELAYQTGEYSKVALVINISPGYAILESGNIYRLDTLTKLSQKLQGIGAKDEYHPQWVFINGTIIIVDGGHPVKIENGDSALLGGDPPQGECIGLMDAYVVISKYRNSEGKYNEFSHSSAGNPEAWNGVGDSDFLSIKDDSHSGIKQMAVNGPYIYFFKDESTEVWTLIGGTTLFSRNDAAGFDVGIKSPSSLVKSLNSLSWLGHTVDFYEVSGGSPTILSSRYKEEVNSLKHPENVQGFDFSDEFKIRWFSHIDEKGFTFDYKNNTWSEDTRWEYNDHHRLPINCISYIDNICYFGDWRDSGKVYKFNKSITNDDGLEIRTSLKFQIMPFDGNDTRGILNKIDFRVKRGVGNNSQDPLFEIKIRADKNQKWFTHYINLGASSDYNPHVTIYPRIYGSEFEFELVLMNDVELVLTDMKIFYEGQP